MKHAYGRIEFAPFAEFTTLYHSSVLKYGKTASIQWRLTSDQAL